MIKISWTFAALAQMGPGEERVGSFTYLSPNPRLYKYLWRVFWSGSPCEGKEFLQLLPLTTKAAIDLIADLQARNEPFIVANFRLPRLGISMWNLSHPRFHGVTFAPAYDDDPDPPIDNGHK